MTDNGSAPAEAVASLASARQKLDPDLLTPRDLLRAQDMLDELGDGDKLKGADIYEVMANRTRRAGVIIWCLKSRTDPSFTFEQALDTPYGEFDVEDDEPDPPTGPPGSPGPAPAASGPAASKPKRRAGGPAPN